MKHRYAYILLLTALLLLFSACLAQADEPALLDTPAMAVGAAWREAFTEVLADEGIPLDAPFAPSPYTQVYPEVPWIYYTATAQQGRLQIAQLSIAFEAELPIRCFLGIPTTPEPPSAEETALLEKLLPLYLLSIDPAMTQEEAQATLDTLRARQTANPTLQQDVDVRGIRYTLHLDAQNAPRGLTAQSLVVFRW